MHKYAQKNKTPDAERERLKDKPGILRIIDTKIRFATDHAMILVAERPDKIDLLSALVGHCERADANVALAFVGTGGVWITNGHVVDESAPGAFPLGQANGELEVVFETLQIAKGDTTEF